MANKQILASIDAGNGGTNAVVLRHGETTRKLFYMPSVRAAASGDSLGLDNFELSYEWVDWHTNTGVQRYVFGDDVVRVTRRHLERHLGRDRYANEFQQFLVAVALAKLGVQTDDDINLTLFCPPSMYKANRDNIIDTFKNTEHTIQLKSDTEPRRFNYKVVNVVPEGLGAVCCFALDSEGGLANNNVLIGQTVVIDIGLFTLDVVQMLDGNFNPETLDHSTYENAALNSHIREPLLRHLHDSDPDFTVLTVDDVDMAIRQGIETGDWKVKSAGKAVDIQAMIERLSERYAEWIANNIIDSNLNGLRGIKSVILVGGGALLVEEHLRHWYTDKVLNREDYKGVSRIHPVDMNAVGGLRLALMQAKQMSG